MKKKFVAAGAVLLATAFIGQTASAKSLEDILKEKGVITEEDYKEVTKVKPFDYKLGKGFTFTSPDEKFQLSFGGRMQFRYTFTDKEKGQDSSTWNAQRIRLISQGYAYTKDLSYKLEIDPRVLAQSSGQNGGLLDAYMSYKIMDEAQILLGQTKTQFARQEITSDGAQEFVDRSPVVNAIKHGYDIGAMLYGKVAKGLFNYSVAVSGGAGQTIARSTNDNMFSARAVVNPLGDMPYSEADVDITKKPLLSIGANYFRNELGKTTTGTTASLESNVPNYATSSGWLGKGFASIGAPNDKFDIDTYGADIAFKWMGLFFQSEYLLAQAEAHSNGQLLRAHGFYAQAGYMVLPELELAFRYSYLDPNRDKANDNITEQIGAISYYFNKHNLKLQADVGNIHTQNSSTPTDDMQYRVQAQIIF